MGADAKTGEGDDEHLTGHEVGTDDKARVDAFVAGLGIEQARLTRSAAVQLISQDASRQRPAHDQKPIVIAGDMVINSPRSERTFKSQKLLTPLRYATRTSILSSQRPGANLSLARGQYSDTLMNALVAHLRNRQSCPGAGVRTGPASRIASIAFTSGLMLALGPIWLPYAFLQDWHPRATSIVVTSPVHGNPGHDWHDRRAHLHVM